LDTSIQLVGLSGGTYVVTVTDSAGCVGMASFLIQEPDPLTAVPVVTNVACFGQSTGAIGLSVSGGTSPFEFAWASGDTTSDLTGIAAGQYHVTVTDAHGCQHMLPAIDVLEPPDLVCSIDVTNVTCYGEASGALDLTISGGTSPYSVSWSTGSTAEDLASLPAGQYIVTVTDASGCFDVLLGTVVQPPALTSTLTVEHVSCYGAGDGMITTVASGGSPGYSFVWSDQATDQDRTDLSPGHYLVTITDQHGCTHLDSAVVSEPDELVLAGMSVPDTAHTGVGSATVVPTGGTAPYTFQWNDSQAQATPTATGLVAGTYRVVVSDQNDCVDSIQIDVELVLGLDDVEMDDLRVYPNPARDLIMVQWTGNTRAWFSIIGVTGKIVISQVEANAEEVAIDVIHLAAGLYSLYARSAGGSTWTVRFAVMR
jgi:hypothetical protein